MKSDVENEAIKRFEKEYNYHTHQETTYNKIIFDSDIELKRLERELEIIECQIKMISNIYGPQDYKLSLHFVFMGELERMKNDTTSRINEVIAQKNTAQQNIYSIEALKALIESYSKK